RRGKQRFAHTRLCDGLELVRHSDDALTARPSRSTPGAQFGSRALKSKANIRLSESTENWLHRFQAGQFGAARGLRLLSPSSPSTCWFGDLESALPVLR